jgi:hypothetical protein
MELVLSDEWSWYALTEWTIYQFHTVIDHSDNTGVPQIVNQLMVKRSKHPPNSHILGYGVDDRGSRVLFPAGAGNFSLHHRFQNGSRAHPDSYPMGTSGSFPWGRAAGA